MRWSARIDTGALAPRELASAVARLCEGAANANRALGRLPSLYRSSVVYADPPRIERAALWPQVESTGWGDCWELTAWRLAETGGDALVDVDGNYLHVYLRRRDGQVEDPSAILKRLGRVA